MKTKRTKGVYLVVGLCVVLALGLSLFGCAPAPTKGVTPIKLGISQDITGVMATEGRSQADGAILAVEEWNEKGGVNGRPIEYIFRNNGGDPVRASASVKLMAEMGCVAAHGGAYSTNGIAEMKVLGAKQIPMTGGCAALANFENGVGPDGKQYFFSGVGSDPYLSRPHLEAAVHFGAKKIAILYLNVAWPRDLKDLELEWIEKEYGPKNGIECVGMVEADVKAADLSVEALKIKAMNPDFVSTIVYTGTTIAWSRALAELDWHPLSFNYFSAPYAAWMGAEDKTAYYNFCGNDYITELRPEVVAKRNEFVERFGYDPVSHWATGYDCFNLILTAIENVGDDPIAIRDWLAEESYGESMMSGKKGAVCSFKDEETTWIGKTGYWYSLFDGLNYGMAYIDEAGKLNYWQ